MHLQADLFGQPDIPDERREAAHARAAQGCRSLALPCGFLDANNKPCRQLGVRPVMIDGKPLVCRGLAMLHCDPGCFKGAIIPPRSYDEDDVL